MMNNLHPIRDYIVPGKRAHLVGIGGVSMSPLAEVLHGAGVKITGSDMNDSESVEHLRALGIPVVIGHRGETLDALQYLTSLLVNKGGKDYRRVTLDTEGYRAKREQTLINLANRMAAKVQRSGRRMVLEPMNPYERRILHATLQDNPHVTTHSEGEEPNRRVVIAPKRA